MLVGIIELGLDSLKVLEYFLIFSPGLLVADHVGRILKNLVVHLVHVFSRRYQILLDGLFRVVLELHFFNINTYFRREFSSLVVGLEADY